MAEQKHIILWKAVPPKSSSRLGVEAPGRQAIRGNVLDRVTVNVLSENEASDLARDPNVERSAVCLPVTLVRPQYAGRASAAAIKRAKADGGSWGVLDVASSADENAGQLVKVAVLDTGIDAAHPAFAGVKIKRRNFSRSTTDDDLNGHGTHCAGTIFGRDQQGIRIGVARGVREAVIAKVLHDDGSGETDAIVEALQWAQREGAHVMSMSVGIDFTRLVAIFEANGSARLEALSRALAAYRDSVRMFDRLIELIKVQAPRMTEGATVVAAAGNASSRNRRRPYVIDVGVPAAALGIVSVGAVRRNAGSYEVASFSNINPTLCAPGVDIVSAKSGGGLVAMSGTSMAAPHVAGVACLWWERLMNNGRKVDGGLVAANVLASCDDKFVVGVTHADRGAGVVRGPA